MNLSNKIINLLMVKGKKAKALTLFFRTLCLVHQKNTLKKKPVPQKESQHLIKENVQDKSHLSKKKGSFSQNQKTLSTSIGSQEKDKKSSQSTQKKSSVFKSHSEPHNQLSNNSGPFSIVEKAVKNALPYLEVRKVRISGTTRQIPSMIKKKRRETLSIRWLLEAAATRQKKSQLSFDECFTLEVLETALRDSWARQRRNELHKTAHANRIYLHYRWW